jgi:hypothetical protein
MHNQWQPVRTAPKDTAVLVYDPTEHVDGEGAWQYNGQGRPHVFVAILDNYDHWISDLVMLEYGWESTGPFTETEDLHPTHWMPLPEAPSDE